MGQVKLGKNAKQLDTLSASDFDFPAQSPGGSLAIGANAITLSPVPYGINGSNTKHYLRVFDGTGTAEACLITGGSAVAGANTGVINISCANSHSGAWKIGSATAGIQEVLYHTVSYGTNSTRRILMPVIDSLIYATITFPNRPWVPSFNLEGCGSSVPSLIRNTSFPVGDMFFMEHSGDNRGNLIMRDFKIYNGGLYLQPVNTGGAAIHVKGNIGTEILIEDCFIDNGYVGVEIESCGSVTLRNVHILNSGWFAQVLPSKAGIWLHDAGNIKNPSDIIIDGCVLHGGAGPGSVNTTDSGILIEASDGIKISNSYIIQLINGILISGYTPRGIGVVNISDCILDSFRQTAIRVQGNLAPFISDIIIDNCWATVRADLFPAISSLENILIDASATVDRIRITNNTIAASKKAGVRIDGVVAGLIINDNHVIGNNRGNNANEPGVYLSGNVSKFTVNNNLIYNSPGDPNNHQKYGVTLNGSVDGIVIGNVLKGNETGSINNIGAVNVVTTPNLT